MAEDAPARAPVVARPPDEPPPMAGAERPRLMTRGREKSSEMARANAVFLALLLIGAALRLLLARTTWGQPDSDEAAGMLMALRGAHGHLSLVFWGANYGGALVTWLEALLVRVFGLRLWIFWIVDTSLAATAVFLLRAIGRRFLTPVAAAIAAGTLWFFPASWLFWSSREYVFWEPAIVFALATALFVLRWFETRRTRDLYLLGLSCGLAIWSYPLIASLIAPPLAIFAWAERRKLGVLARAAAAAIVGVSPWLAYFALHGRAALHRQAVDESRTTAIRHSVTRVLPATLVAGQKRFALIWQTTPVPAARVVIGVGVMVVALASLVWFTRRRRIELAACSASVLVWPIVVAAGHVPVSEATFRYGLIVVPPLLLLAAHLLSLVKATAILGMVALALVLPVTASNTSTFTRVPACDHSLHYVADFLVAHGRARVWGSYWLAGDLALCEHTRLDAAAVAPTRDAAAEREATAAPLSTYVVFPQNALDNEIARWTAAHDPGAERALVAGYAVWSFAHQVRPSVMGLDSAF